VSFFDDEPDDEPTRANRPARPRQAQTRTQGDGMTDAEMIQRRRLVGAGVAAVLALILIFGGMSCASSRKKSALKSYNQQVANIIKSSDTEVSPQLFSLLTGDAETADAAATANKIRQLADQNVKDAKNLDVPGDMTAAQRNLEQVLNLRANGIKKIAGDLGAAKTQGRGAVDAIRRISGQMQLFLASDVIYSQYVKPLISEALADADLKSTEVLGSRFLQSFGWLDFGQTAERVNPDAGGAGSTPTGEPAPGSHGHGLTSTAIGSTTLVAGDTPSRVTVTAGMALAVTFQNQGDNDEANVKVTAKVQPSSGRAYTTSKTVSQTKSGESANVSLPLTQAPAKGSTATITVTIGKVPGEQKTDNNTASYTVFFN